MKILNLYAGIGGNRKLWGDEHEVTAVEIDPEIAKIYQDFFPEDTVIVGEAHAYLQEHYKEFDFIWSSPPCQSHSQIRYNLGFKNRSTKAIYPDCTLYEEILFLKWYFKGKWVVENTRSFYEPLVPPQVCGGHYFWANFPITNLKMGGRDHRSGDVNSLQERKQLDISAYPIGNKRQILRNCVEPELGKHVFDCLLKPKQLTIPN